MMADDAELDVSIRDGHRQLGRSVELVTLGSPPIHQSARTVRLIGCNLSATTAATIFVSLGAFRIPVYLPVAASAIANYDLEIYNSIVPIDIWDFTIDGGAPPGMTGALYLLIVGH
jgi:hypothetical protein